MAVLQCYDASMKPNKTEQIGFLLSQIGIYASAQFAERIRPLGLSPAHAGILRILAKEEGINQRDLGEKLSILPSRLVVLIDELEAKGLAERKTATGDRRSYELYLSAAGKKTMQALAEATREHSVAMGKGLTKTECDNLTELLSKLAESHGLIPEVHPGYRMMGKQSG